MGAKKIDARASLTSPIRAAAAVFQAADSSRLSPDTPRTVPQLARHYKLCFIVCRNTTARPERVFLRLNLGVFPISQQILNKLFDRILNVVFNTYIAANNATTQQQTILAARPDRCRGWVQELALMLFEVMRAMWR